MSNHNSSQMEIPKTSFKPDLFSINENPDSPFVHRFETKRNKYIYDANSMQILRVEPIVWNIISDIGIMNKDEIISKYSDLHSEIELLKAYNDIRDFQQNGLFLSQRPEHIFMPLTEEYIENELSTNRQQLILNVTDKCNFGCSYCQFNGSYRVDQSHSEQRSMSWEVAQKAIDSYLASIKNSKLRSISFYGGEPLLNFELIQKCVEYTPGQDIRYALTTNGSMLEGPIADYLASNNFLMTVSLDGPKEIHDRYRRFKDGSPSWDKVIKNIYHYLEIQQRSNDNIGGMVLSCVMAPPLDVNCLDEYFHSFLQNHNVQIRTSSVNKMGTHFPQQPLYGLDVIKKKFSHNLQNGLINENPSDPKFTFQLALFDKPWIGFHKRFNLRTLCKPKSGDGHWCFPKCCCPTSTCVPGVRRTFVSVDGDYWPCERVLNTDYLKIGDIEHGFNITKIRQLLADWVTMSSEQCRDCWCLPLCGVGCWSKVCAEKADQAEKLSACMNEQNAKHQLLIKYSTVLENNPHALDYMKNITVM